MTISSKMTGDHLSKQEKTYFSGHATNTTPVLEREELKKQNLKIAVTTTDSSQNLVQTIVN